MRHKLQLLPVLFVIPRKSSDEQTVAIVQANVASQKLVIQRNFLQRLIRSTNNWVRDTRPGQRAWVDSQYDLNIGDLHHYEHAPSLKQRLVTQGIHDLSICLFSNTSVEQWEYDTILVDPALL
jgi:hypothetical protein